MIRKLISLFSLLCFLSCTKDKLALPDAQAGIEDLQQITPLADELAESSGLIYFNQKVWSHNDSGDQPHLYNISTDQAIINQTILLNNVQHVDWEDLTQDDQYIYIGDFGNNSGQRQNLLIYKVAKDNLTENSAVFTIRFSFSDQINFNHEFEMHNFNCEAMIAFGNYLYLFSKNHLNQKTKLYRLAKSPGAQIAELIDEFDTRGLITGADYDPDTQTLCLIGYSPENSTFQSFLWLFFDFAGSDFWEGKSRRIELPIRKQTEGICTIGNGNFYISNENEDGLGAWLYQFDTEKWK